MDEVFAHPDILGSQGEIGSTNLPAVDAAACLWTTSQALDTGFAPI